MKNTEINVRKTFLVNGKRSFHEFTTKTNNVNKFFMERLEDVKVFADSLNGKITAELSADYLYISYLDIPNIDLIDVMYLVKQ